MAVVLVTGVARELGAALARTLASGVADRVIAVDSTTPQHDLGRAEYLRVDIGSPAIARVIDQHAVQTVVHLALVGHPAASRGGAREINVLGAMQLFAACQQAATLDKLVVQSSISVYGASATAPARFTEESAQTHLPQSGLGKDALEVESYARGLARRRPDCCVTTLRLANLIGRGHDSRIVRHLTLPVVPRVLGFDPRMQFLHPDDAIAALSLVIAADVPGTYNVAAPDVITLNQALALLGRPSVGVPRAALPWPLPGLRGRGDFGPDEWDALTHGRVMDVTRFTQDSGFVPQHTTRGTFAEFAAGVGAGMLSPERVDRGLSGAVGIARRLGDVLGVRGGEHR